MGKEILNIIDSSKAAVELIVIYDNQWKESFKWLNELYEEMKLKLINDKRFLLRNTPAKRKRKVKSTIPTSPIDKENNSSSKSLKLLEGSKENLDDNSLGIRKSKRIALKGITNQSTQKDSDFVYSTIKSKRIRQRSRCNDEDACTNDIKTQINKRLSITTEPCVEEEKINANETKVLQSVSKNSSSSNKKISKDEDVSENKENQLSKTPLKYKNTDLSNLSTPSVKHRIQTYEEHIKIMNTPKFPVKATRKSSSVRKSLHHKLFKRSRSTFKTKKSLSKKRKSKTCSLSKNNSNKTSITSMENCKNINSKNLMEKELNQRRPTLILKRLEDFSPEELKISSGSEYENNNAQPKKYKSQLTTDSVLSTPMLKNCPMLNCLKMTPVQKSETFQSQLAKNGLSTGIKFTPKISPFTSTSKLLKNPINRTSKLSSGVVKQTPQASLSCTSQRSLISRVMSLKQQMTPSVKEKICHDIIKKQQKEEEVLLKKSNLLKMKIEEQKRKREERMRKVTETRQKLELEKDQKRNVEISKEEKSAKKEAELKQKQRETIKKKQLIRKQKQEEVKERKKKEENRLQKFKEQTPTKSTLLQKAIHNSYQTKEVEEKADNEQLSEQDTCTVLNETYNKNEKDPESYEMTPVRSRASSGSGDPDNYDIADLKSDDETDDECAPRKKIPNWARGMQLRASLLQQHCNPPDFNALFGDIDKPDLTKIFPEKRAYFQKRTSSAVWLSPSFSSN